MWYDLTAKIPKESLQVDLEGQKKLRKKMVTIREQALLYNPRIFQVGRSSQSYYNIVSLTGATIYHHTSDLFKKKTEPILEVSKASKKIQKP